METLRIRNIKSFADSGEIVIKPITVFVGRNSCGKSSLLRFPAVLAQTANTMTDSPIRFYGNMVDYGNYEDVKHKGTSEKMSFELKFRVDFNLNNSLLFGMSASRGPYLRRIRRNEKAVDERDVILRVTVDKPKKRLTVDKVELILDDECLLHNFSYRTRISAREFCEKLIDLSYIPEETMLPSEYIKNQNMYFDVWDKDPTIRHMLVMLDSIHRKFYSAEKPFLSLLTRDLDADPIITFSYLPMENYALTDDLYIKMNARGKNLSNFENFKAKFIQHLKKKGLPYEHFEASIDTTWTDLLWDYRSRANNTIDDQFMFLFLFFTEMIYLENSEQRDGYSPFKVTDIRGLISFYDKKEKVEELYELFDLWKSKEEIDECFDSVFTNHYCEGKVRIFDDDYNLFDVTVKRNGLKIFNKVILFLFMRRLIYFRKNGKTDNNLQNYVRIIRNFVLKVRQRKAESYQSDFRFYRHGVPYISFGLDELLAADDIYGLIAKYTPDSKENSVNSESLKYEQDKAEYILNNPKMEEFIHRLEDMDEFKSCIHNVMPFVKKRYIANLADDIKKLYHLYRG